MKIQKKFGGGGGVRVDVNKELEVFEKIHKKWGVGGVLVGGGGVRVDVNEELKFLGKFTKKKMGVGGNSGYGGCEPRIEGQCTKRYCTIFRKSKMWGGGGGEGAIFEPKTLSMY